MANAIAFGLKTVKLWSIIERFPDRTVLMRRKPKPSRSRRRRSPFFLLLLLIFWSLFLGWGLSQIALTQPSEDRILSIGTIDPIPDSHQVGYQLYLQNCGSCHIAIPPGVVPRETWFHLIQDPEHYGREIRLVRQPQLQILWNYLQTFSRPKTTPERERFDRIAHSEFFHALHVGVDLPEEVTVNTCIECHPHVDPYSPVEVLN